MREASDLCGRRFHQDGVIGIAEITGCGVTGRTTATMRTAYRATRTLAAISKGSNTQHKCRPAYPRPRRPAAVTDQRQIFRLVITPRRALEAAGQIDPGVTATRMITANTTKRKCAKIGAIRSHRIQRNV